MWHAMRWGTRHRRIHLVISTWTCILEMISMDMQLRSHFLRSLVLMVRLNWLQLLWSLTLILLPLMLHLCFLIEKLSHSSMSLDISCTTCAQSLSMLDSRVPLLRLILLKCLLKCLRTGYGAKKFCKEFQAITRLESQCLMNLSCRRLNHRKWVKQLRSWTKSLRAQLISFFHQLVTKKCSTCSTRMRHPKTLDPLPPWEGKSLSETQTWPLSPQYPTGRRAWELTLRHSGTEWPSKSRV